jgi:hypothetical protein
VADGIYPAELEEINLVLPLFLRSIEASGFSVWLRESPSLLAYPAFLAAHTIGMAFLAGPNVAIDLRILGVAPRLPLAPLERFFRLMWLGFYVNAISGVVLLIAYPTKALTDPVFYVKLGFVVLAVAYMQMIRNRVFRALPQTEELVVSKGKFLAVASLICWVGAITAGKFMEYTYRYLIYPS